MTKDIYTEIAMKIFKIPAEDVTSEQRDSARTIAFAHLYGRRNDSLDSWLPRWLEEMRSQAEDEVRRLEQEQGLEHSLERIKTLGRLRALNVVLSKIREEEGSMNFPVYTYPPDEDQPATCPKCGKRTVMLAEDYSGTQVHRCPGCLYVFIYEEDPVEYEPFRTCPHCGGIGQFDDHIDDEVDNYYCLHCERDFLVLVGGE